MNNEAIVGKSVPDCHRVTKKVMPGSFVDTKHKLQSCFVLNIHHDVEGEILVIDKLAKREYSN
jgi:hypothetical protein